MNNCGYYSCFKGKPQCKHPAHGETNSMRLNRGGGSGIFNVCDMCKRANGGIYPHQVHSMQHTGSVDVVDKNGSVIN